MACRICSSATRTLIDLGESPPANSLKDSPDQVDQSYPLVVEVCDVCANVQMRDCIDASVLYSHYSYMTPDSPSLAQHYEHLFSHVTDRGLVNRDSYVLEVGSNTGLFLQHIKQRVGRVLGIDYPAMRDDLLPRFNQADMPAPPPAPTPSPSPSPTPRPRGRRT